MGGWSKGFILKLFVPKIPSFIFFKMGIEIQSALELSAENIVACGNIPRISDHVCKSLGCWSLGKHLAVVLNTDALRYIDIFLLRSRHLCENLCPSQHSSYGMRRSWSRTWCLLSGVQISLASAFIETALERFSVLCALCIGWRGDVNLPGNVNLR